MIRKFKNCTELKRVVCFNHIYIIISEHGDIEIKSPNRRSNVAFKKAKHILVT